MSESNINNNDMKENERDFRQTICNMYIIAILAVLPLYIGEGYYMLGDRKYLVFRNISLFCIGLWLAVTAVEVASSRMKAWFQRKVEKRKRLSENENVSKWSLSAEKVACPRVTKRQSWSTMDTCMLFYAAVCLLSFLCSAYRETAWSGYRDWYMGALSQLIFVGIYFFVSREYTGTGAPLYLGEAALGLVALIGFGQKLGIDPLRLLSDYVPTDWGYSHMLSTVGNINWLCGYMAVVICLPVAGYLYSKPSIKRTLLYIISILGLALLCMQGSEIGIVIALACVGICLFAGLRKSEFFERGLALTGGTLLVLALLGGGITLGDTMKTMPAENNIFYNIPWYAYLLAAVLMWVLRVIWGKLPNKVKQPAIKSMLLLGSTTVAVVAFYSISKMQFNAAWGSGRGGLWTASVQGFLAGDWKQKLIGAGPDCFAEYLYSHLDMGSILEMEGHWSASIFANAHNEWLNTLVNLGILGVMAYLGIFLCGVRRYRGMMLGVLVLGLYAVNSLVSFQQVMNAPVFFLVLGVCENRVRREE